MPVITLPDGSQKQFDHAISVAEVAASIGPGLAKAALAGRVNGKLVDTSTLIDEDATFRFLSAAHPPPVVFSNRHERFMEVSQDLCTSFPPIGTLPSKDVIDRSTAQSNLDAVAAATTLPSDLKRPIRPRRERGVARRCVRQAGVNDDVR